MDDIMDSTIIFTYPVYDIVTTIKSREYGAWMNEVLTIAWMNEVLTIHNGVMYARQFYRMVAFVWQ